MSILERCPTYRESNKGNKQRQGPTLGVRLIEVSVKRESTVFNELKDWTIVSGASLKVSHKRREKLLVFGKVVASYERWSHCDCTFKIYFPLVCYL